MIIIKKGEVKVKDIQLPNFQEQFEKENIFICPELLSNSIQPTILDKLKNTSYIQKIDQKKDGMVISQEYAIPHDAVITRIINFYLNQEKVINTVRKISNNQKINSFKGRVYKFEPDKFSFDNWHDDTNNNSRLLGLSINLSEEIYQGGEFQIRDKKTKQIYAKVKHLNWGSAHFFRIHPTLEHMVSKIKGNSPRVAFAGWFMNDPFFN
jgi:hypothetical protein